MHGLRETIDALVNPTGGLRYHARAVGHRRRLWGDFRRALALWLAEWQPAGRPLLLVGPSAGWCLPDALFRRFPAIDVLEPDPLARLLLGRRLRALGHRPRWHATDYLGPTAAGLPALAADFPRHAILFCNVLGQLGGLDPDVADETFAHWKRALAHALRAHDWATFHDRLSGPLAPTLIGLSAPVASALNDDDLARRFYPTPPRGPVALDTHGTADLLPDQPRRYLVWHLRPRRFHLIEAVRQLPPSP